MTLKFIVHEGTGTVISAAECVLVELPEPGPGDASAAELLDFIENNWEVEAIMRHALSVRLIGAEDNEQ